MTGWQKYQTASDRSCHASLAECQIEPFVTGAFPKGACLFHPSLPDDKPPMLIILTCLFAKNVMARFSTFDTHHIGIIKRLHMDIRRYAFRGNFKRIFSLCNEAVINTILISDITITDWLVDGVTKPTAAQIPAVFPHAREYQNSL